MKKLLSILLAVILGVGIAIAKNHEQKTIKIYCEITCVQYNLLKDDVNVLIDFGIAEKAKNAKGWIFNKENGKKYSFASRINVLAYMAKRDWEYEDTVIIYDPDKVKEDQSEWHIILSKKVPLDYSAEDVIGDIDYRNNKPAGTPKVRHRTFGVR